ncbi:hypothetical protein ANN_03032 [Periplaneta americana]|uniref:DUF7869 domain-containing protein n=1 Tax=Periplaneta americana TaxID=6978 RepID=A0ABQ8U0I1_PERAM|nr:hypothetical protein ANN_03032 [Periplaneta americana]
MQFYMRMWDKSIASRGTNEIASCLLKLINMDITNKKNLIIWSDNCAAQNKSRVMALMFLFLVVIGLFGDIKQRFILSGHSFLQCDSDFALIEKRKKVAKAFIPSDQLKIVQDSKIVKPFQTVPMLESDVADQLIFIKNLNISKACCIQYDVSKASSVSVKQSYDNEAADTIKMLKKENNKHERCAVSVISS